LESTEQLGFGYIPICYQIAEKRSVLIADLRLQIDQSQMTGHPRPICHVREASMESGSGCRQAIEIYEEGKSQQVDWYVRNVSTWQEKR
jgi:hypothetical protein